MIDALHRIWSLVVKEFRQLSRDRLLMGFILIAPMLELLLMGTLVGEGIQNLPLAVVDLDRSRASRELIARLDETDELMVRTYGDSVASARDLMQQGEIAVILTVPPGYGEQLVDPRKGVTVQVITDDSNYVVDAVAVASVETVAGRVVQDLMARHAVPKAGPVELRFLARFNAALDDRPGAITAMLGLIVYQVTLVIAAQSFTRERELGTMEQLRITPLGKLELILGKAVPTLLIGL
ncbi:MAG: ABC transporter permease, partial [Anaerolineae bacterium]